MSPLFRKSAPPEQPIQRPLTLVMKAKSALAFAELKLTVQALQALPAEMNPVVKGLNKLATVHFARFVFLDDHKLAVITSYDGSFDDYINDFINEIGDIFNTLIGFMENAPPQPVQTYRKEFLEYIHEHDLGCVGPFYSAYPDRTVLDIVETAKA
jgi:hypothetical protein